MSLGSAWRARMIGPPKDEGRENIASDVAGAFASVERASSADNSLQPNLTQIKLPCGKEKKDKLILYIIDEDGMPQTYCAYVLEVDGQQMPPSKTDGDGKIEEEIPIGAKRACVVVTLSGGAEEEFDLTIGDFLPVALPEGAKPRLANLGFDFEDRPGIEDLQLSAALLDFQAWAGFKDVALTGLLDQRTMDALIKVHEQQSGGIRRSATFPDRTREQKS